MAAKVFISYRRATVKADAGRIFDAIQKRLGVGSVFIDTTGINPGDQYPAVLDKALNAARFVVRNLSTTMRHFAATITVHGVGHSGPTGAPWWRCPQTPEVFRFADNPDGPLDQALIACA